MRCNLGCGKDYRKGWLNIDFRRAVHPDVIMDLNDYPYPLKDNQFEEIEARMILEHLDNPIRALKEMIRIAKPYSIIKIIVPHANSYAANTDITHKTHFTENSFTGSLLEEYDLWNLQLVEARFLFNHKWKRFIPFKNFWKIWCNGIYDDIEFTFEVLK